MEVLNNSLNSVDALTLCFVLLNITRWKIVFTISHNIEGRFKTFCFFFLQTSQLKIWTEVILMGT